MKKSEVQVGKTYVMKVSGRLVPVLVTNVCQFGGWYGRNTLTQRDVRIHSAAKLRYEHGVALVPMNKYGEVIFLHGPVCGRCSQRIGRYTRFIQNAGNENLCWHCAGIPENESLESASECVECGAPAVPPKSLCCGRTVVTPSMGRWYRGQKLSTAQSVAKTDAASSQAR